MAGGGVGGDAPHCGRVGGGCSREMDGSVEMPCGCPRVSARAAPPPRTGLLLHARMPPRASPSRRGVRVSRCKLDRAFGGKTKMNSQLPLKGKIIISVPTSTLILHRVSSSFSRKKKVRYLSFTITNLILQLLLYSNMLYHERYEHMHDFKSVSTCFRKYILC